MLSPVRLNEITKQAQHQQLSQKKRSLQERFHEIISNLPITAESSAKQGFNYCTLLSFNGEKHWFWSKFNAHWRLKIDPLLKSELIVPLIDYARREGFKIKYKRAQRFSDTPCFDMILCW